MMKQSLWALAAAALFSVMAAFVKLCSDVHGPIEMVFYRSLFGVLVISLFVFRNRATLTLKTPHIAGHIKRSVLGTLSIMLWFFTLGKMHFGTNMTLIYTTPLFMAANFVILALMRHKPAPWALVLATIAGFTGVTIVLQPSFNEGELIPALICLGVSLLDLVIYWQMKELGDMKEPSWRIVFYFTLFGTIAGLIACYVVEGGLHMPNAQGLVGILGMGLCATLGQICTTRSYAYGNMLLSSCLGFSAIPFSVIISFFWFGESVTAATLTGAAVILCSGMMATVATKRTEAAEKAAYITPVPGGVGPMTRAMLITTLYRMSGSPAVTGENPYSDVPAGSYYEKAVIWAMQKGVANGMGGGKFEPDTTLNRAMVATVLYRLSGDKVSATNAFPDVPANEWYGEAVAWAQQKGIVTGFEDGTFRPMEEISRQDMALMLQRYAKTVKGTDTTPTGDLSRWPDAGLVGSWAVDALRWCVGAGIINGKDGGLQPTGNATRAEFATILMRYAKL